MNANYTIQSGVFIFLAFVLEPPPSTTPASKPVKLSESLLNSKVQSKRADLKADIKDELKALFSDISEISKDVAKHIKTTSAGVDDLCKSISKHLLAIRSLGLSSADVVELYASSLLNELSDPPSNQFIAGAGGNIDIFAAAVNQQIANARKEALLAIRAVASPAFDQLEHSPIVVRLGDLPDSIEIAPTPQLTASRPHPKLLQILVAGATSNRFTQKDGVLSICGCADKANGDVKIDIEGPGAVADSKTATPDNENRFSATFSGTNGLVEGNYVIKVSQGAASAQTTIGIP
ncbi:MAG: hypothetical protein HY286_01395 [Planctomycetes bacterium]|nr:hypothetical protein [Planctomycetota bacterium]